MNSLSIAAIADQMKTKSKTISKFTHFKTLVEN